ncbi:MAG: hypothetical protein QMD85_01290 [Candidatus Aenigmarchaeota archaeon]|nr:hypothetical protein [Candidatus Aenigmarchaeota archaeon]MDI6722186.1 hypothetical protein [Candidatus Aenigmarchaeota archaeon]
MRNEKGFIQIDYAVAFGLFFVIIVLIAQYSTNYFSTVRDNSEILLVRSEALDLLSVSDFPMEPLNWTNEAELKRIGFSTRAYKMLIVVNNTSQFLINRSASVADITSELVTFNYSENGFDNIDINSTVIYDENNNSLAYQISTTNITFSIPINASQARNITVYFDDDSNFTSRSASVTGTNNLTETLFFPERVDVMQFKQIQRIMNANYTLVRNATSSRKDFNIILLDVDRNTNFFSFGDDLPRKGNIVALQKYILYQNSSGFVRKGKLTVQVG